MADNDLALGRLVDAVSHSSYWKSTAIFVVEDDAQDGPDHVDAHRSVFLAISPYTQSGKTDSTRYDTASTIGTLEDLLGLPPMSIYDDRAARMWPSFQMKPNLDPYDAIRPSVVPFGDPGAPINGANAPLAAASQGMNFAKPDAAPEDLLSLATWRSIKGANSTMPAPRHSLVVPPSPATKRTARGGVTEEAAPDPDD
jgi:hypothetical protein